MLLVWLILSDMKSEGPDRLPLYNNNFGLENHFITFGLENQCGPGGTRDFMFYYLCTSKSRSVWLDLMQPYIVVVGKYHCFTHVATTL